MSQKIDTREAKRAGTENGKKMTGSHFYGIPGNPWSNPPELEKAYATAYQKASRTRSST